MSLVFDFFLYSEADVEWYDGPGDGYDIDALLAEMGGLQPEEDAADETRWDLSNYRKLKATIPQDDDPTENGAGHSSLPISIHSSASLSDSDCDTIKPSLSPQRPNLGQSPCLYSDSDSDSVSPSILRPDLPQFVVDCPKKPVIVRQRPYRKLSYGSCGSSPNIFMSNEVPSSLVSNEAPSPHDEQHNSSFNNVSSFIKVDIDSPTLSENRKSRKRNLKSNKSPNNRKVGRYQLRNPAGSESIKQELYHENNDQSGSENRWKQEIISSPKNRTTGHESCQNTPVTDRSLFVDSEDDSPLDREAQRLFNVVDQCLLSTLVQVKRKSSRERTGSNTPRNSGSSVRFCQRRRGRHFESPTSHPSQLHELSSSLAPLPSGIPNTTPPSSRAGRKGVCIRVVPMACDTVQEIKSVKNFGNQYALIEKRKWSRKGTRLKTDNKPCPPSPIRSTDSVQSTFSSTQCNQMPSLEKSIQSPTKTTTSNVNIAGPDQNVQTLPLLTRPAMYRSTRGKRQNVGKKTTPKVDFHQKVPVPNNKESPEKSKTWLSSSISKTKTLLGKSQTTRLPGEEVNGSTPADFDSDSALNQHGKHDSEASDTCSSSMMLPAINNSYQSQNIVSQGFVPEFSTPRDNLDASSRDLCDSDTPNPFVSPPSTQPFIPVLSNSLQDGEEESLQTNNKAHRSENGDNQSSQDGEEEEDGSPVEEPSQTNKAHYVDNGDNQDDNDSDDDDDDDDDDDYRDNVKHSGKGLNFETISSRVSRRNERQKMTSVLLKYYICEAVKKQPRQGRQPKHLKY